MTKFTPILRIPYPEASDPPRGWEQMQAIAEKIDAVSPVWIPLPLESGIIGFADLTPHYAVLWGRVWLRGAFARTGNNPFPSGGTTLSTLPAAIKPVNFFNYAAAVDQGSGTSAQQITANPDGKLYGQMIGSNTHWISVDGLSYPTGVAPTP